MDKLDLKKFNNVKLKSLDDVSCNSCNCKTFIDVVFIKRVSSLLTENGKVGYIPIPAWACSKCGNINDELNPIIVNNI